MNCEIRRERVTQGRVFETDVRIERIQRVNHCDSQRLFRVI
jgi:hypothetical protein